MANPSRSPASHDPSVASRRRFVTGLAAGGLLTGAGLWPSRGAAALPQGNRHVLSGTEFDLTIDETPVNMTGRASSATAVNGSVPAPVLRWREGDTVTLRVQPAAGQQFNPLARHPPAVRNGRRAGAQLRRHPAGWTFVYRFDVKQSGTYWYHSHSRFQEQTRLYAAIVIEPRRGERLRTERDNFNEPTAVDFARDASRMGLQQALAKRKMWNRMRMRPTDLSDVTGHHYTYLVNGASPAANWTALFSRGEKVRLRVVNGSAQSIFDFRVPGLKMTVVAADGQDVEPVSVDEARIATAEVYDVIVEPRDDRAYTFFAQSIDRMGYARGTLAPREGMQAEVPATDPPKWLTMMDMMGAMAMGGDMGAGHDHASMSPAPAARPQAGGHAMPGMEHGAMGQPAMPGMQPDQRMAPMVKARHARSEYGPGVDMRVHMPRTNIDDPGIGLRDNGRKVLSYADLHTIGGPLDPRGPGREIELHLTGHMERYMWSFDGQKFSDSKPLHFRHGISVRIARVGRHAAALHRTWPTTTGAHGSCSIGSSSSTARRSEVRRSTPKPGSAAISTSCG